MIDSDDIKAETGRRLTTDDILGALRSSDPAAFISEQERGCYVIDGRFDLGEVARTLSEMLRKSVL